MDVFCLNVSDITARSDELMPYLSMLRLNKMQGMVDNAKIAQSMGVELALCYAVKMIDADACIPVNYHYNSSGKPVLNDYNGYNISFSHTSGMSVVAIAKSEVGVDIELRKEIKEKYAVRLLNSAEYEEYMSSSKELKAKYLLNNFVKKESYVKATGVGLTTFPSNIQVPRHIYSSVQDICGGKYVLGVTSLQAEEVNIHSLNISQVIEKIGSVAT